MALRIVPAFAGLALAGLLQGCATLSEADCLSADWAVMGEADGRLGKPVSELNRYRRDCAGHGVVPDTPAYLAARQQGLAAYCTQDNGYREGRVGATGGLVCPVGLEPGFRRGYDRGRAVYDALTELRSANDAISSARRQIEQLESDVADRRKSERSDDLGDDERQGLREEIDAMERDIKRLEQDIGVETSTLAVSIAGYHLAVDAARRQGHDEPMDTELLLALRQFVQ